MQSAIPAANTQTFLKVGFKKSGASKTASCEGTSAERKPRYSFRQPGESFVDFWLRFSKSVAGSGRAKDEVR